MGKRVIYRDQRGATAIEYALIAALIAVAGIAAFQRTGDGVEATMTDVSEAMPEPAAGAAGRSPAPTP